MTRLTGSGKIAVALIVAALGAAPAVAEAAAVQPEGAKLVASGTFSLSADGTTVSGVLPPGFSADEPPVDPGDPGYAKRFAAATNRQGLSVAAWSPAAPASFGGAAVQAQPFVGCVSAISSISGASIYYKGQMAGCRRGNLWLHTYLNRFSSRVQDGGTITCANSTSCSVPNSAYRMSQGTYYNYAHGRNLTTGGDDTAWQEWYQCGC